MKHTPGPWMFDDEIFIFGPNREMIAEVRGAGDSEICQEANARLIAAATELLKSLEALVEQFHAYENGWLGEVWRTRIGLPRDLQEAEAAIRKAKGE